PGALWAAPSAPDTYRDLCGDGHPGPPLPLTAAPAREGPLKRVVVGMSGGVDSSVAAALLLEQGYEVIGATMLVWSPPGVEMGYADSCCGLSAAEDARRVCARLGIRHYTLDFRDLFYESIVRNYV